MEEYSEMDFFVLLYIALTVTLCMIQGNNVPEAKPCLLYDKPEAQVILVEKTRIVYVCEKLGNG